MARSPPDLTLIIPTFNRQLKTERALRSVAGQDVDTEILVVDDGSPAPFVPPPELAASLDIKVLRQDPNRGPAAARNAGVAAARSDWITFLDSDDALAPGTLRPRLDFARTRFAGDADPFAVYACAHRGVQADGTPLYVRRPRPATQVSDFASGCWFCPGSAVLMRREAALRVGPQDVSLTRLEDLDWFLRLALLGGTLRVQDLIGVDVEVGHKPNAAAVRDSAANLAHKWRGVTGERRLSASELRRLRAYLRLERAAAAWYAGHRLSALGLMAASAALVPRLRLQLSPGWW